MVNIKNKIVLATALFAVMMVMTGIAAAQNSIQVSPGIVRIDSGGTATQTVTVASDEGNIKSLTVSGVGFNILDKFTVTIDGVENTSVSGNWASPKTFTVVFKDGKGETGDFTVNYEATFASGSITKTAEIQSNIEVTPTPTPPIPVPEFPSLALPMAAIIGLVLLFQYRNRRE